MAFLPTSTSSAGQTTTAPGIGPARTFAALGSAGLIAMVSIFATFSGPIGIGAALGGVAFYASASAVAWGMLQRAYPHTVLGLCNGVTQLRLLLLSGIIALLLSPELVGWPVVVLSAIALSLDGVDGWLARREGLVSEFGARFDMEVDSALALTLALGALVYGAVGPAVLVLGLARYVFWGASQVLPWLNGPLDDRFSRKVICVLQIGTLVVLQAPDLPPLLAHSLTFVIVGALAWSFGRDILLLRRQHRAQRTAA
ncbi:MAG: CDP-alcohol phosphatidyltransferase family protein [Pseudomonadota bacterium]